nr:transcription factor, MADS-box [Tanacetum cinerariifolium]
MKPRFGPKIRIKLRKELPLINLKKAKPEKELIILMTSFKTGGKRLKTSLYKHVKRTWKPSTQRGLMHSAAKLEQREHDARTRLEFKKRNMNITYQCPHNFGNMPSMYHFAGLGLGSGKPDPELDHRHMLRNREPMAAHGYPSVDYGRNVYDNNLNHSYLSFHQQQPLVQGGNNNPYLSFHQQKALLQGGNDLYLSLHQQQGLVQGGMLSQFEPQEHDFHASNGGAGDFVADRVFFAELNEVLPRELAEDGSSGIEVRVTREKRRRITKLTSLVYKRFKFPENVWSFTLNELTTEGFVPLTRLSYCEFVIQASQRACCPQGMLWCS